MTATMPVFEQLNREAALKVLGEAVDGAAWHKGAEIGGVAVAAGFNADGTIIQESVTFQPPLKSGEDVEDSRAHTEVMNALHTIEARLGEIVTASGVN